MKRVRKAVIPAAGRGTRFLPASKAVPKEMFPIIDKPVIQWILEEAASAGIEEVLIVTGERKPAIEAHFARDPELEASLKKDSKHEQLEAVERLDRLVRLEFTVQEKQLGLGHAVWCAKSFVGGEPFAVLLGDMVSIPGEGIGPLVEAYRETQAPIFAVEPVAWSEVGKYGVVKGDPISGGLIAVRELVEKPKSHPPSNLAIMGRYVLEPDIFAILEGLPAGAGGEIQLTDALQSLARNRAVYALAREGIRDVGDKLGYLQAAVEQARHHSTLKEPFESYLKRIAAELTGTDPKQDGRESS